MHVWWNSKITFCLVKEMHDACMHDKEIIPKICKMMDGIKMKAEM